MHDLVRAHPRRGYAPNQWSELNVFAGGSTPAGGGTLADSSPSSHGSPDPVTEREELTHLRAPPFGGTWVRVGSDHALLAEINPILRGWCGYFNQGPVTRVYRLVRRYTERRMRRWLMRRQQKGGTGYRQYPDRHLYGVLGLFKPPETRGATSNAKA